MLPLFGFVAMSEMLPLSRFVAMSLLTCVFDIHRTSQRGSPEWAVVTQQGYSAHTCTGYTRPGDTAPRKQGTPVHVQSVYPVQGIVDKSTTSPAGFTSGADNSDKALSALAKGCRNFFDKTLAISAGRD